MGVGVSPGISRSLRRNLRTAWESRDNQTYRRLAEAFVLPDGSRHVYCHHIRKTAGTSLHSSFLGLGGEDPHVVKQRIKESAMRRAVSGRYTFVGHRPEVFATGEYCYGWSHEAAHQVVLPPDTFTITLLRDPAARVVSLYRYLRAGDEPGVAFRAPANERALAARGFDHFLDEIPPRQLLRQLYTFSAAMDVDEAAEAISACSFVFMCESFDRGLSELADRLDLPLALHRERVSKGPMPDLGAGAERLRDMLEPEYQLLDRLDVVGP